MRVRQVDNALDLFELFAKDKRPLTLTAIATRLDMPKSSVFNLIDTLLKRGLIYETKQRGGYYPTQRLYEMASEIMDGDVFLQHIHGELERLAQDTGETVLLATRQGAEVVYVDVVESASPIRYFAKHGERRPLCTTSTGKAILSSYPVEERRKIVQSIDPFAHRNNTHIDSEALLHNLALAVERGWTEDRAEFMPDVMGIGVPLVHGTRRFGLAIAGPLYRMEYQCDVLATKLRAASERMQRLIEHLD
jgi:DNA-binding IclR family transcriptional regulator